MIINLEKNHESTSNKKVIYKAIKNERQTNTIACLAIEMARNNGNKMDMTQAKAASQFVITYVNEVPIYIEEGLNNAAKFGIRNEMNHMMDELEQYWKLEEDLIPDDLGLIGITDDAYASMFLFQSLSGYCQTMYGRKLLKIDLKNANDLI